MNETIHWYRKCLALTFCVLCLILVLRGYSIPVDSIRRMDLFIPQIVLWGDTISRNTGAVRVSFIHSFIQAISIAPPQVHYYSEALHTQHGYCVEILRRSASGNCE